MVAGIVLVALGMKKTLGHVEDPLKLVPAAALFGGAALYLLAHVAFRYRHVHTLNTRRLALAVLLVALTALATELPAIASLAILAGLLIILIVVETHGYGDSRARTRDELRHESVG
jgi:low temperature requirement protein LtrA